jgi:cytidylate kinase
LKKITIAIDGHSSCGKSTLAKELASKLGYIYIDSGAMYRATTLYFLQQGIRVEEKSKIAPALSAINIRFNEQNQTLLNGRNVEKEIRQMSVSEYVSEVAAVPAVRKAMVAQQRLLGKQKGIVMDGRDIGTVVFPDAELKIFLTASLEERTRRRFTELQAKGNTAVSVEQVTQNLQHRDHIDSTREDSPLKQADDAIVIDNTHLDRETQLAKALHLAQSVISEYNTI